MSNFLSFCSPKSETKYKMNKQRVLHVYTRKLLARVSFIINLIRVHVQLYNISSLCLNFTGPTHYILLFILVLLSAIRRPLLSLLASELWDVILLHGSTEFIHPDQNLFEHTNSSMQHIRVLPSMRCSYKHKHFQNFKIFNLDTT